MSSRLMVGAKGHLRRAREASVVPALDGIVLLCQTPEGLRELGNFTGVFFVFNSAGQASVVAAYKAKCPAAKATTCNTTAVT